MGIGVRLGGGSFLPYPRTVVETGDRRRTETYHLPSYPRVLVTGVLPIRPRYHGYRISVVPVTSPGRRVRRAGRDRCCAARFWRRVLVAGVCRPLLASLLAGQGDRAVGERPCVRTYEERERVVQNLATRRR